MKSWMGFNIALVGCLCATLHAAPVQPPAVCAEQFSVLEKITELRLLPVDAAQRSLLIGEYPLPNGVDEIAWHYANKGVWCVHSETAVQEVQQIHFERITTHDY